MKKGFLITFEGGEGCGKSSQVKKFEQYLSEQGKDFVLKREPGGTEFGEKIREILLHDNSKVSPKTEFFLFCASRAKLVDDVVRPALEEDKIVVLDRFYDSTFAYEGYGGGLDLKPLKNITKYVLGNWKNFVPDMTVLLDVSYEDGMKRKANDAKLKNLDRYESLEKEFHDKVRAGYLQMAKHEKKRFFVVDGTQDIETIHKQIVQEFERRLAKKN